MTPSLSALNQRNISDGRGIVTVAGKELPPRFEGVERVVVDEAVLSAPGETVGILHERWLHRQPVVVELRVDARRIREPEVEKRMPHELESDFEFSRERLHFLLWANNYDGRGEGDPIWWWGRKAERAFGGRVAVGGPADVLVDGNPAWCDGGPRQPLSAAVLHADSIEAGVLRIDRNAEPRADLAPDQLEAVRHQVGPARVIAPAGSGKTRVLSERLRHLVDDRGWDPDSILALAYNKRAADEMAERTAGLGVDIRTLNSVAYAICNGAAGFAAPAGRSRRSVLEESGIRALVDQLVELRRAPNTDPYVPYLEGLSAIRLALIAPEVAEIEFDAPGLAQLFDRYCALLEERGQIDFDGQIYEAIRILLADPAPRAAAQRQARHLLVDEFQDLTPAHLLLVRLLAAPTFDVFGVGDDDQVIYGFAGATPRYLIDFARVFPGAASYALEVNYRCPPEVVDAAGHLLSYNDVRVKKTIRSSESRDRDADAFVVQQVASTKAAPVVLDVLRQWDSAGVDGSQIAVLARANATLLPVQVMLTEAGVPCRTPLTESILDRTGTRTALAYLRIGLDPGRITRADVSEVIRRPGRRISRNVVEMLTKRPSTSLSEIKRLSGALNGGDVQKLTDFARDLEVVERAVRAGDVAQALRAIRVKVGLGDAMDVLSGARREVDRSSHGDDLLALEQVAALHAEPATFEPWLRETLRRRPSVPGGIELSTIHRVKGREWDRVVVYAVDSGLLPHRLSTNEEEERRLLHVAITRARQRCVVIADDENSSVFLGELDGSRSRHRTRKVEGQAKAAPIKAAKPQERVVAEVGLWIRTNGGYEGEVIELGESAAYVSVDAARLSVSYGDSVQVGRKTVTLVKHGTATGELTEQSQALADALRGWRSEAARRDGVPAYVILSNEDVLTVARAAPRELRALSACRGIGATRLERWGDEMLSVIEAASET